MSAQALYGFYVQRQFYREFKTPVLDYVEDLFSFELYKLYQLCISTQKAELSFQQQWNIQTQRE